MGIRTEASGPVSYLVGWFDRDYGASALVARKDVVIDATALPSGITIAWAGGEAPGARVLAVEGDLTLRNVAITGGRSNFVAVPVQGQYPQPWTLARGGAVAVWGVGAAARTAGCYGNQRRAGIPTASRDRGAFGGAAYADIRAAWDGCIGRQAIRRARGRCGRRRRVRGGRRRQHARTIVDDRCARRSAATGSAGCSPTGPARAFRTAAASAT